MNAAPTLSQQAFITSHIPSATFATSRPKFLKNCIVTLTHPHITEKALFATELVFAILAATATIIAIKATIAMIIHVMGQAKSAALNAICASEAPTVAAASAAVAAPLATLNVALITFKPWLMLSIVLCINKAVLMEQIIMIINNYTNAYKKCSSLYDMKMVDIKLQHLQTVIDNVPEDYKSVDRIKVLFTKLYDWCIKKEYLKKNYAVNVVLPKVKKSAERRAFKKEHIQMLWDISPANDVAKIALIYIYSGVRPNELLDLLKENVHLEEQYFEVKKSKTEAGIRIVPIANKVLPFWKHFYEKSKCKYAVCTDEGEKFTYDNFRKHYWNKLMESLKLDYYMYETRHTCNTLLVLSGCNPTIRKKIIGHKREMDLGEVVYTHIYIDELLEAINQI